MVNWQIVQQYVKKAGDACCMILGLRSVHDKVLMLLRMESSIRSAGEKFDLDAETLIQKETEWCDCVYCGKKFRRLHHSDLAKDQYHPKCFDKWKESIEYLNG